MLIKFEHAVHGALFDLMQITGFPNAPTHGEGLLEQRIELNT
jgi:hypothetical protein